MKYTDNWDEIEKFDNLKNKMLKYILYKKRSEQEIRKKFESEDENMLEDAIEYLKSAGYINDFEYVERTINEYIALKKLSIKELKYKICQKGIDNYLIDKYICDNKERIMQYEINSAKYIIMKKSNLEELEIKNYLLKKGYLSENINLAFEELEI